MLILFLTLTVIFLIFLSVSDIRTKTIPGWVPPIFGAGVVLLHFIRKDLPPAQMLAGLIPGAVLLLLSLAFNRQIGIGDGAAVASCGLALGLEYEFAALTAAFVLCSFFCIFLLVGKGARRSDDLAFLPFLAASHTLMLLLHLFQSILH